MRTLTRNISFSRSVRVSTSFGVNCARGATNDTAAGMTRPGAASSTMRPSEPTITRPACSVGRKIAMYTSVSSSTVATLLPAASTSPGSATRYRTRPRIGDLSSLSAISVAIFWILAVAAAMAASR